MSAVFPRHQVAPFVRSRGEKPLESARREDSLGAAPPLDCIPSTPLDADEHEDGDEVGDDGDDGDDEDDEDDEL